MDKYEYNLKLEEIDKLVDQKDYEEAAKLADTIDWRRVRNVRTLCLISEIYEAAGRLEDSKAMLLRAYRKSPVGRTVLYRLVEVTTELQQYDEALEYYSEYVQAAPHDNNRYILKYRFYKKRGNQIEELIAILEEYLGQEYTERWAYELATLYQQSGQMQKCLAACDDLVLWFHSGKYVAKALELKKRYAALTPKQQQIYEECVQEAQEEMEAQTEEPEEDNVIQPVESASGEFIAESIIAQTEREIANQVVAHKAEKDKIEEAQQTKEGQGENADAVVLTEEPEPVKDPEELQVEMAKSMRKIISGVVKNHEEMEDDIPASVDSRLKAIHKPSIPEPEEQIAGQLSIDDILLSMSDKGKQITDVVLGETGDGETEERSPHAGSQEAAQTKAEAEDGKEDEVPTKSMAEAAADELTDMQREALQYTNHPEKLLRNKGALPTYVEEDDLGKTRKIVNTREELLEAAKKEILSEKTIRLPSEEIARKLQETSEQEVQMAASSESPVKMSECASAQEEPAGPQNLDARSDDVAEDGGGVQEYYDEPQESDEHGEYLEIPQHLRSLFTGFTEVEGLEDQIANAIIQAESKGDDRTSRSGNILIFGAHGSGKTTLAMNIAKAIAQDKGSQTMKVARIYAADLNRKDIAATVAKIAGGTLIIEEAGDLEPGTVEQLTTAMEFRTDGLIVIVEDEQQYIHELLMRHPRFTMKFTAQIYLPAYTVDELAGFGQICANAQDYMIGDEAYEVLCQKLSDLAGSGAHVSVSDVVDMVGKAITRSNKFFRKLSMGKKRYDENDYIVLFPKDFK